MKNSTKEARKEMIKLVESKGLNGIINADLNELQERGYTYHDLISALRWLTYSPQTAKYRA